MPRRPPMLTDHETFDVRDQRISLRPVVASDYSRIATILLDPRVWEQGFGDGEGSRPHDYVAAYGFLYREILVSDRRVYTITVDGRRIGIISYFQPEPENARVEIGKLLLDPECWGHGYMLSALKAMLRHAFAVGYHRVMSEADVLNDRSIGVLTKAGFRLEGTRKHSSFHADGTRRDISIFAVTLDDTEVIADVG